MLRVGERLKPRLPQMLRKRRQRARTLPLTLLPHLLNRPHERDGAWQLKA